MALDLYGNAWAWGFNFYGQLGNGTNSDSATPVLVSGLTGTTSLSAGFDHSMALLSDGTVWTWGNNGNGQLGNNTIGGTSVTPVQVVGPGGSGSLTGISAISAGETDSLTIEVQPPTTTPTFTPTATATPTSTGTSVPTITTTTATFTPTAAVAPTNTPTTVPTIGRSASPTPIAKGLTMVYLPVIDVPLPPPTPTPTVVSLSTATPIPNPIRNGSFEVNGLQDWTQGSTGHASTPVVSTTTANSGAHSALLGDPTYPCFSAPSYGDSYVSQQVSLPAGSQPTLTYYIDMRSQDFEHDEFAVYANNLDSIADRLDFFVPTNPSGGQNPCVETDYHWQKRTVAIPAQYLGKPLTLYFVNATSDQNWDTWTYLDDVSITFP